MSEKIHFETHLLILRIYISGINDILELKTGYRQFIDKIIYDIVYIDKSISQLYNELKQLTKLLKRPYYLLLLIKTKVAFITILEKFVKCDSSYLQDIDRTELPNCHRLIANHLNDINEIKEEIANSGILNQNKLNYQTVEELQFLLNSDEGDDILD